MLKSETPQQVLIWNWIFGFQAKKYVLNFKYLFFIIIYHNIIINYLQTGCISLCHHVVHPTTSAFCEAKR